MRSKRLLSLGLLVVSAGFATTPSCAWEQGDLVDGVLGQANQAAGLPTVMQNIVGNVKGSSAWVHGTADSLSEVSIFDRANCAGQVVSVGAANENGAFVIAIPVPSGDKEYSAIVTGAGTACSNSLTYHTVHRECPAVAPDRPVTRTPISALQTTGYFDAWGGGTTAFDEFYTELLAHPPTIQYHYDFPGALPLDTGFKGTVRGVGNPYWGHGSIEQYVDQTALTPDEALARFDYLHTYLQEFEGLTLTGQYGDFGTQLMGDHIDRKGFWAFYDHWDDYDSKLDLAGSAPPDPNDWLKRHWDPSYLQPYAPPLPAKMTGLVFEYGPTKSSYGANYRYTVDILSEGFSRYWGQVVRHAAMAGYEVSFFDNSIFRSCWNQDCEDGYDQWLAARYSPAEIDRYMSYTKSRFDAGTFDVKWLHDAATGTWSNVWITPEAGATIKPDIDAVRGPYSCQVQGPGLVRLPKATISPNSHGSDWRYFSHYKTTCVNAEMQVQVNYQGNQYLYAVPLARTTSWREEDISFFVPASTTVDARLYFTTGDACELWLDDASLQAETEEPVVETRLARSVPQGELGDLTDKNLGAQATTSFWNWAVEDRMTYLRSMGRQENATFDIFTNSGRQLRGAGYFMVEQSILEGENKMSEVGSAPGTYLSDCSIPACVDWGCDDAPNNAPAQACRCLNYTNLHTSKVVTNIFDFKLANDWRYPDEFAYLMHLTEPKFPYFNYTQDAALLQHAEGAAFGGGAGLDMFLGYHHYPPYYPYNSTIREDLLDLRDAFFAWTEGNSHLYRCLEPASPIGLVYHDIVQPALPPYNEHEKRILALATELSNLGLPYDVVTEQHLDFANLSRYRAVVYHHVDRVSEAEALALTAYMQAGGIVFLSGDETGRYDGYFRLWAAHDQPLWPPVPLMSGTTHYPMGNGMLVWNPGVTGVAAEAIQAELGGLNVTPSLPVAAAERFRVALWKGPRSAIAHLVNYDVKLGFQSECDSGSAEGTILDNVTVNIPLDGSFTPVKATAYSPETLFPPAKDVTKGDLDSLTIVGTVATVQVPRMHIYSVIVLE